MWLQAVSHLHFEGRGHCDIKTTNIVVHFDADYIVDKVTLIDLGFSHTHIGNALGQVITGLCTHLLWHSLSTSEADMLTMQ